MGGGGGDWSEIKMKPLHDSNGCQCGPPCHRGKENRNQIMLACRSRYIMKHSQSEFCVYISKYRYMFLTITQLIVQNEESI